MTPGDQWLWERFGLDWALHAMTIQGLKDLATEHPVAK